MSKDDFQSWLIDREITDVEAFVPDMAGTARGKVVPAHKFGSSVMKIPEAIFAQTISGMYVDDKQNVEDRDMILIPDASTLRIVPWASSPTASVFLQCVSRDGSLIATSPRSVLRSVLDLYASKGWTPVVAPEVEFYLVSPTTDPTANAEPPEGRLGWKDISRQPYSIDTMYDFDPFISDLYRFCEAQGILIDTLSQEMGPAQFEINFMHGDAFDLADQVFLFKRTVREAAIENEMRATFLSKPMAQEPGSALHVHQSVVDQQGRNIFSDKDGKPSDLFYGFLGGLQKYMSEAMLIFAPYVNSYRRFTDLHASPVNLSWAYDNRTVGFRVPDSSPESRRIENRLAGSDVNPYLVLAGTLACGYLGMTEGLRPTQETEGSAYGKDYGLHRHIYSAIEAFRGSAAMRSMLGDTFVGLYSALKEAEYVEFQEIITPWEREILMLRV